MNDLTKRGITPAHAGTTHDKRDAHDVHKDHPRSRGDNFTSSVGKQKDIGSPPLTRGQLHSLFI